MASSAHRSDVFRILHIPCGAKITFLSNFIPGKDRRLKITNFPIFGKASAPILLGGVALFGVFLAYVRCYLPYSLYGDDPAVLGASAGNPGDWFTSGFSRYFRVYPEWFSGYTDFIRPVWNGILRLDQSLFGNHFMFYFLVFCAAQFLLIMIVVLMARDLGVQTRWQVLLALLLAIEPAFFDAGLFRLSDQVDTWCGLFAIEAFFFLSRRRYGLTLVALTLAIFTKESALFAPIAACLTVAYGTRRKILAGTMLLPLVAWLGVRKFVFVSSGVNGIYVLPDSSLKGLLFEAIKGVQYWPTGFSGTQAASDILLHFDPVRSLTSLFFKLSNPLLCILLLIVGIKLFRKDRAALLSPFTVFVWMCGALSFGILVVSATQMVIY
jgi:hypothetical protein